MEGEWGQSISHNMRFSDWVLQNGGFDYYISQLEKVFEQFDFEVVGEKAYVRYKGYLLLIMIIEKRSIVLIRENMKELAHIDSVVQKKLLHEYEFTFRLNKEAERRRYKSPTWKSSEDEGVLSLESNGEYYPFDYDEYSFTIWEKKDEFKITQMNHFLLRRYLDKTKTKIDLGFDRYNKLLHEQNLYEKEKAGFLKVFVDGSYSVAELNILLDAYNRLYAVLQCAYEYGYEETDEMDITDIIGRNSMVLENISIASPGFFVSVLSGVASNLISHLIEAWISGDVEKADKYKEEAIHQAHLSSAETGDRVEVLLQRLESNLRRKQSGILPTGVVDIEIQRCLEEIKELQGIPTINVLT